MKKLNTPGLRAPKRVKQGLSFGKAAKMTRRK